MAEDRVEIVGVRSNVDRLSVSAVHHLFADFVYRSVHAGEDWMRMVVPLGKTLRMERAITAYSEDHDPVIEAGVGIPPIAMAADQGSPDYPKFVATGTGLFDPHGPHFIRPLVAEAMKFEGREGDTVFASDTRGQKPNTFLLSTYEEMTRVDLPLERERFAERVKHLYATPDPGTSE